MRPSNCSSSSICLCKALRLTPSGLSLPTPGATASSFLRVAESFPSMVSFASVAVATPAGLTGALFCADPFWQKNDGTNTIAVKKIKILIKRVRCSKIKIALFDLIWQLHSFLRHPTMPKIGLYVMV
jgi:hypothetical protein